MMARSTSALREIPRNWGSAPRAASWCGNVDRERRARVYLRRVWSIVGLPVYPRVRRHDDVIGRAQRTGIFIWIYGC